MRENTIDNKNKRNEARREIERVVSKKTELGDKEVGTTRVKVGSRAIFSSLFIPLLCVRVVCFSLYYVHLFHGTRSERASWSEFHGTQVV